ncbi:MAG: glycosyltransferase family 39 protein [Desulfobacteraceae bacterium]|jgi:tetratricopeptide (TPR) repeat protein|nr:glycosyltransferase family 39 protein [Desulfobacteraceae bacterium]
MRTGKKLYRDGRATTAFPKSAAVPPREQLPFYTAMGLIFALALFIRALCLIGFFDTHILQTLVGDAELYDIWAKEILTDGWIGKKVFFQAPFYPYFIAVIYRFVSPDPLVVRWVQVLIGATSCALMVDVGRSFFSTRVGILSGILLSLYPVAIYYDILIQKAVLGLFFTVLILFLLGKLSTQRRWSLWPVVGLVLGMLVLVRENALILFPVILFWLVIHFWREGLKRIVVWGVLMSAGFFCALFPVALRNHAVGGEWFLTTSNLGFNLYMGNNTGATGTYTSMVPGQGDWRFESDDARKLAEKELERSLSQSEISQYWTEEAVESIRSDIKSWARLLLIKWKLLWGSLEMSDSESIYAYQDFSPILRILGCFYHFGILLPIATAGFLLTLRHRRRLWIMYSVLAGYAIGIMPFYVMARYRAPMLAVMVPFAAAGVVEVVRRIHHRAYRSLVLAMTLSAAIAVYANSPLMQKSAVAATTYYNWASVFENQGHIDLAIENYKNAIQRNPRFTLALNNLGILYCGRGDFPNGIRLFKEALKIDPRMAKTHMNIAIAYYHTGKLDRALYFFRETLRNDPDYDPIVNYNIACVLSLQNDVTASLDALELAIKRGYANWDQILSDPDLENARRSPRFGTILKAANAERSG